MDLKDFNLDHWWKMTATAGALAAIASAPASFVPGFLIGVGLLLFGTGEWSMHHKHEEPFPATFAMPAGIRWVLYRRAHLVGVALDALGVVSFARGFYLLLTA